MENRKLQNFGNASGRSSIVLNENDITVLKVTRATVESQHLSIMMKFPIVISFCLVLPVWTGDSGYHYPQPEAAPEPIETAKYIYYFKPPQENYPKKAVQAPQAPAKKVYRYIFIQAPSFPQPEIVVPPQQPVEEKTLLYVLSKKEEQQPIFLPTPVPPKVLSPEVYYINYNSNKKDVQPYSASQSTVVETTTQPTVQANQSAAVPPSTSYGSPVLPALLYKGPFNPDNA